MKHIAGGECIIPWIIAFFAVVGLSVFGATYWHKIGRYDVVIEANGTTLSKILKESGYCE